MIHFIFQVLHPSQDSPLPPPAKKKTSSQSEILWPEFHNRGQTFPTTFEAGKWRCPLCHKSTPRIRQHLSTHKALIDDWTFTENYCNEITVLKRKEVTRKSDQKRADDSKRKETLRKAGKKADQKRADEPSRKETLKKADQKRADDPKRKEAKSRSDRMLAADPKRKEMLRKADKKYAETRQGKIARLNAQERYRYRLDDARRKAQYRKYKQTKIDKERGGDAVTRRTKFQKAVLRGPEYTCSSCHRMLYRKSVTSVTDKLREKIKAASEAKINKANEQKTKVHPEIKSKLKKKISFEINAFKAWNYHLIKSVDDLVFLCSTCKNSLQKGNMPSMAVANGLQLRHQDRPRLTELENQLIAFNINFQKMVLLPKSRMSAGKGRMISIPLGPSDIMNTAQQLPRLPSEAGVVPIKLKRKKEYKTHEKHEQIRPEQIFLALRYLRHANNPYYQFYDEQESYLARCRIKEQRGLRLLVEDLDDIEEDLGKPASAETTEVEDQAVAEDDDEGEDELEIAVQQEEEDIQNDPVRRQHFNYNEYSALVNGHPDIFLDSEGNQVANLDFAPGEGKRPTSALDMKDWDVKSWPLLLPDGKFGLDHKRKVKLTRQNYFHQRILNVDDRFAKDRGFIFAATSLIEAERLRANANMTGMKGRRNIGPDGQMTFHLEDPCSVFEKIPGTPKYWQRTKYEMIAKLENIGPFQVKKLSHSLDLLICRYLDQPSAYDFFISLSVT